MPKIVDDARHYDYVIAGAGCAGLGLAFRMSQSLFFSDKRILLIDKSEKSANDRTWCYWSEESAWYDAIAEKQWNKLNFEGPALHQVFDLDRHTYFKVKGSDYYRYTLAKIAETPYIERHTAAIEHLHPLEGGGMGIQTQTGLYTCDLLFDGLTDVAQVKKEVAGYNMLLQHFKGYELSFAEDVFQTDTVQMFDFNIDQAGEVRFIYILPISARKGLVEFTVFGPSLLSDAEYTQALESYFAKKDWPQHYKVISVESGVIPMSDYPFATAQHPHHIRIGAMAGMWKPSTGYGFLRIQRDCQRIVEALEKGRPIHRLGRRSPARFRLYDAMMLYIMAEDGGRIRDVFAEIFSRNPIHRVLAFLDERTHFGQELLVMASVKPWPFLKALWWVIRRGKAI